MSRERIKQIILEALPPHDSPPLGVREIHALLPADACCAMNTTARYLYYLEDENKVRSQTVVWRNLKRRLYVRLPTQQPA
jgi:hypothetical protein